MSEKPKFSRLSVRLAFGARGWQRRACARVCAVRKGEAHISVRYTNAQKPAWGATSLPARGLQEGRRGAGARRDSRPGPRAGAAGRASSARGPSLPGAVCAGTACRRRQRFPPGCPRDGDAVQSSGIASRLEASGQPGSSRAPRQPPRPARPPVDRGRRCAPAAGAARTAGPEFSGVVGGVIAAGPSDRDPHPGWNELTLAKDTGVRGVCAW